MRLMFAPLAMKLTAFHCAAFLVPFGVSLVSAQTPRVTPHLRIGLLLPLTGPASGNARYCRDGAELARGLIASPNQPELVAQDFGSDQTKAVTAFRKLVDEDHVDAVLVFTSPATMAVASVANELKIPLLAAASVPRYSSPQDFTFRVVPDSISESNFLAGQIAKRKFQKVAVLYVDDDYGTGNVAGLEAAFQKFPDIALLKESFPPQTSDFRSLIPRLKGRSPDAVIITSFAPAAGTYLRQAKELGYSPPSFCTVACQSPDLFKTGQGAEDGLLLSSGLESNDSGKAKAYRDQFHEDANFLSWGMFDGVNMLAESFQHCSEPTTRRACLREQLMRSEGFDTSRGHMTFDVNGDLPISLTMKKANGGRFENAE